MTQQSDESLRAYLDRREKQLTEDIAARHSELAPMEAELAEVRRAKGALGIPQVVQMSARLTAVASSRATLSVTPDPRLPDPSHWQNDAHEVAAQIVTDRHRQTAVTGVMNLQEDADHFSGHGVVSPSPYEHLTMKQLIMKAMAGYDEKIGRIEPRLQRRAAVLLTRKKNSLYESSQCLIQSMPYPTASRTMEGGHSRTRYSYRYTSTNIPLERFPIGWNHLIEKESLRFKELEHVLIEKVGQLFRNML